MHLLSRIKRKALSPRFEALKVPVILQRERMQAVLDPVGPENYFEREHKKKIRMGHATRGDWCWFHERLESRPSK